MTRPRPKTSRQPPRRPSGFGSRRSSICCSHTALTGTWGRRCGTRCATARHDRLLGATGTAPHQHRRHRRRAKPSWDAHTDLSTAAELLYLPGLYDLSVQKAGDGVGTVTSPAGIDCGVACSGSYAAGAVVTLTATPATGSSFAGWGGNCSGTGNCTLTMSAARLVSAEFAPDPAPSSATRAGVSSTTSEPTTTAELAPGGGETHSVAPAITRLRLSPIAFRAAPSGPALVALAGARACRWLCPRPQS